MKKEKRVFVVNGEEMVGTILEETESFHIIGFLDYQRGKNLCYEEYNYMKPDGTLLSPNENFVLAGKFSNGVAPVCRFLNQVWNIIKSDGTFLLSENLEYISEECKDGFFVFADKKRYNYMKPDGSVLSPNEYFEDAWDFNEGLGLVQRGNDLFYYIKPDGTFLNKEGFVDANSFKDCIADITINCKLDKNGNIII